MECTVENDWEGRVRRYIRPDTGEVAKTEQIPYEECQLNMNKALDDATPKPADQAKKQNADETPPEATTPETVVDDGALTPEAVAEAQATPDPVGNETIPEENETTESAPDDFPPPDETEELEEEPANVA